MFQRIQRNLSSMISSVTEDQNPIVDLNPNIICQSRMGSRTFSNQVPLLWNQLPLWFREADTISTFKVRVKTSLLDKADLSLPLSKAFDADIQWWHLYLRSLNVHLAENLSDLIGTVLVYMNETVKPAVITAQ